jgi:serine/threonine-protein kinase
MALGVGVTLGALWPRPAPPPSPPLRLSAELGADASLVTGGIGDGAAAVLSPDGALLAFAAGKGPNALPQLYVRRLEELQASPLPGTEGAHNPFFSPDGKWIAFFAERKLKKVAVTGGAVVTLCEAPDDRGGSWGVDGTIVFTPRGPGGLSRVSSAGGTPEVLTTPDPSVEMHRWPQVLPGGRAVVYTAGVRRGFEDAAIAVQPLPGGPKKVLVQGGYHGRYLPSGHLVYIREGTLFAAAFDLDRLQVTGEAVPVLEGVMSSSGFAGAQFAHSDRGALVYLPGGSVDAEFSIHWMDSAGKTEPLRDVPSAYGDLSFSPDGRRLAMDLRDGSQSSDVWVYEWGRDTFSRLTFDTGEDTMPVWTPDGRRIVLASRRADKGTSNLYWQWADGTGDAERLTESKNMQYPGSWHPSGKFLAFSEFSPQTSTFDVMILPMEGSEASGWKPGEPTVFLNAPFIENNPKFSPDGRWLAYESNESGRVEVYVRPFPGPGGKWQVSTDGGNVPMWSRAGRELFYRGLDESIMVAPYTDDGESFRADKPRFWSEGRLSVRSNTQRRNFDLHPDGQRVAVIGAPQGQSEIKRDKVVFILNFFDYLRRIAPAHGSK